MQRKVNVVEDLKGNKIVFKNGGWFLAMYAVYAVQNRQKTRTAYKNQQKKVYSVERN